MKKNLSFWVVAFGLLVLLTGCKKDALTDFSILAVSERADNGDAKTHLYKESLVLWDNGDQITLRPLKNGYDQVTAKYAYVYDTVVDGTENKMYAVFKMDNGVKVPREAEFIALYPHMQGNEIVDKENVTIKLAENQQYVGDETFGKMASPMVACCNYHDSQDDLARMLFHNLCGLVRIQVANEAVGELVEHLKVDKIILESHEKTANGSTVPKRPISGTFKVNDCDQYNPYLSGGDGYRIVLEPNTDFVDGGLFFYVSLPSVSATGTTTYALKLTVEASSTATTKDGTTYSVSKDFTVPIRRNSISFLPALTVKDWVSTTGAQGSLAGNGTQDRPFLVYTLADLKMLRDACNKGNTINGCIVNSNTWVNIMRSDIELDEEWEPFKDFPGKMVYKASQASSTPGITNRTGKPLFWKLSGRVMNLTIKCGTSIGLNQEDSLYSPLCYTNTGEINGCKVVNVIENGATVPLAIVGGGVTAIGGLCVYNQGTITSSGCRANLSARYVGGLCYKNTGTIINSYTSSPMTVPPASAQASTSAAGIVYENATDGLVSYCYMAANINGRRNVNWGGIVYKNTGGDVKHCYLDASGIIQSNLSIGGIVNTMTGGTVDYCWVDADLLYAVTGNLGGIVCDLSGGEVRNSFVGRGTSSITCERGQYAGGIVAIMTGGSVKNSYAYCDLSQSHASVGQGTVAGGVSGGTTLVNCYGHNFHYPTDVTSFYGVADGTPSITLCYSHVVQTGITDFASPSTLHGYLNSWQPNETDTYRQWVCPTDGMPTLTNNSSECLPLTAKNKKNRGRR